MEETEALAGMVENGDYCDGWGRDDAIHEERDWGDEISAPYGHQE